MTQAATWGAPRVAESPISPADYANRVDDSFDALLSSHSGGARPAYAVAGTVWMDSASGALFQYDGTNDLRLAVNAGAPASATAPGTAGQVAWDADYFYVCAATNTWKRVALATW